jgi:hypothetical protein
MKLHLFGFRTTKPIEKLVGRRAGVRSLAAVLLLAAAAPVFPQTATTGEAPRNVPWTSLSTDQQKVLSRFEKEWEGLSPQRQQTLSRGSDRWLKMSPEQRKGARTRFQRWQEMSPDDRRVLRQRFEEFNSLSPQEQESVRENFRKFKELPPKERAKLREQWDKATPAERKRMLEKSRQDRVRRAPSPKKHPRKKS